MILSPKEYVLVNGRVPNVTFVSSQTVIPGQTRYYLTLDITKRDPMGEWLNAPGCHKLCDGALAGRPLHFIETGAVRSLCGIRGKAENFLADLFNSTPCRVCLKMRAKLSSNTLEDEVVSILKAQGFIVLKTGDVK